MTPHVTPNPQGGTQKNVTKKFSFIVEINNDFSLPLT